MHFHLITIFPDFFRGPLDFGIVRRAREAGLIHVETHDLRAFTHDRHKTVDDRPFGGGEGMVLKPEPIFECVESLGIAPRDQRTAHDTVILLSPQGKLFDQQMAEDLAHLDRITIICGRYEGVDERVALHLADREVSIGNFVLSGGELGAAIILDAVTRLLPGALGNHASNQQESFRSRKDQLPSPLAPSSTCTSGGLLDYPHYTRPADFRGMPVPPVLSAGNHDDIRQWRRKQALAKTLRNRPDLLLEQDLSPQDRTLLHQIREESANNG